MNNELVENFNNGKFKQRSAVLKIVYYSPKNPIIQHLPIKEKVNKFEINRMRNGYITSIMTSVDIQEIVKIGDKLIQICEGVLYRENYKVSPFKKVIDKLFELRQKYKEKNNEVMQLLVKLIMKSLKGEFLRKDILESYQCKSEMWMMTEYDEIVLEYQKINRGNCIVKMKDDEGIEDEVKKVTSLPLQLAHSIKYQEKNEEFYTRYRWILHK